MDRESREVVDIIDEIQETLALEVSPINYPIGKEMILLDVMN